MYHITNIEAKVAFLIETLCNAFDMHAPVKTVKPVLGLQIHYVVFIIKEKDIAFAYFKRNRFKEYWEYYNKMRNLCTIAKHREKAG